MTMMLLFCLQGFEPAGLSIDDLPSALAYSGGQEEQKSKEEKLGFEMFYLRTSFDDGLKIEDSSGVGGDVKFGVQWKGRTTGFLNLGYAGWNTETDDSKVLSDSVTIRQYRIGASLEFPFKFVDLGIGVTGGLFRFHSDSEDDTSPYIEFEGTFGVRPVPEFRIALIGLATHTQSSFNREHTHLFHNYSGGVAVEVRF